MRLSNNSGLFRCSSGQNKFIQMRIGLHFKVHRAAADSDPDRYGVTSLGEGVRAHIRQAVVVSVWEN